MTDLELDQEIQRCEREIGCTRATLLAGHRDVQGLCLALADWKAERRLLEDEKSRRAGNPAAEVRGEDQWARSR